MTRQPTEPPRQGANYYLLSLTHYLITISYYLSLADNSALHSELLNEDAAFRLLWRARCPIGTGQFADRTRNIPWAYIQLYRETHYSVFGRVTGPGKLREEQNTSNSTDFSL